MSEAVDQRPVAEGDKNGSIGLGTEARVCSLADGAGNKYRHTQPGRDWGAAVERQFDAQWAGAKLALAVRCGR